MNQHKKRRRGIQPDGSYVLLEPEAGKPDFNPFVEGEDRDWFFRPVESEEEIEKLLPK